MIKYYLSQPYFSNQENKLVSKAIKQTWVSSTGPQVKDFEKKLSRFLKVKYTVATNSGTSALHLALLGIGVTQYDEVLAPSLTFVATINSILYTGAKPIFFDSDDFFNIKINDVIKFIDEKCFYKKPYTYNQTTGKRIKAIIIVHVWGNAVNISKSQISYIRSKGIKIIEDSTESLGTKYIKNSLNNQMTGTIGDVGCFSFNGNKIITTGSGGAVVTNNKNIFSRVSYLANQSKDDSLFFVHNEIGFNYKMSNLSAALGIAQINKINKILKIKKMIYMTYLKLFKQSSNNIFLHSPSYALNNNWMNIMILNKKLNLKDKNEYIKFAEKNYIQIRPVWKLNHLQKQFTKYQTYKINNSLKLYNNSFCIPSDVNLHKKDIKLIQEKLNG